jgi:hypothetical protein
MIRFKNKYQIHYLFFFILSLNYLIPILFFGSSTLFYIDSLDSEIVYNSVLGKVLKGDIESVKLFLGGEISPLYLRRLLQPYSFVYSLFTVETAYWIIDIAVKIVSYFSFFILAKKINSNIFICALVACLYASSNLPTHEGFGLAILPYIIYLSIFKNKLIFKHYAVIIFFGLNSDLLFAGFALPSLALATFLLIEKKQIKQFIKIFFIFSISIILANLNIFYIIFENISFHRNEMLRETFSIKESIVNFFKFLFPLPYTLTNKFLMILPISIFVIPSIIISFFTKDIKVKKILITLIITIIFIVLIQSEFVGEYLNNTNFFKKISWGYLAKSYNLLYCMIVIFLLKNKNFLSNILLCLVFTSILIFQINSSVVPLYKEKVIKINNYQNFYTFDGYYSHYDYKKIKNIIKKERTLSVGVDPMIAVKNEIYVLDGYHSLYPLSYKKKFREIINDELEANIIFKNYYDTWGSRVYTTLYGPADEKNFHLNLKAAKSLGAKYIISSFKLKMEFLEIVVDDCIIKNNLCLYKIN